MEAVPSPRYTVAVRQLCEFTAKAGDLDLRFTPSPTAEEGIEGHNVVARRRGAAYRREVRVETQYRTLRVRGRIDGYDPDARLLEEVKTHRGAAERIPANHRALHWAQAQVYGALLCEQLGLAELRVSVVYFDIDTRDETPETRSFTATELRAFFEAQCDREDAGSLVHRVELVRARVARSTAPHQQRRWTRTLAIGGDGLDPHGVEACG